MPRPQKKRFTFELAMRGGDFGIKRPKAARWTEDGTSWIYTDRVPGSRLETFWKENAETGQKNALYLPDEIRPQETYRKAAFTHHKVHGDGKRVLFFERGRTGRPTRSHGNVFLLEADAREIRQLTHTAKDQRNAKLSPDGRLMGVVRADDIYVLNLESEQETRLTQDGDADVPRYNGRFGWVYEEELGLTDGFLFSPDSRRIAYWQTDESKVPIVDIQRYDDLHMRPVRTRYPKAGDPNPVVRIGVVGVEGGPTNWLHVNLEGDHYLSYMQWLDDGRLLIQRIPRLQQHIDLLLADPDNGQSKTVLSETGPFWVDGHGEVKVLKDGTFLWLSDRGGFNHLYLYDLSGKLIRRVTEGRWEVTALHGVDEQHQLCYFSAAQPDPTQRQLLYTSLGGGEAVLLTEEPGVHSINMNPQATLYVDNWSNHTTPPQSVLYKASGRIMRKLVENDRSGFEGFEMPDWEYGTLRTDDRRALRYKMLKPAAFDSKRKHPVYMSIYGGPGAQSVMDSWDTSLFERHLTELGFICFVVDNRGGGGRGRRWRKMTYKDLGNWETHDQAEGAKWLAKQTYVDAKRLSMYGWSYGGYMACLCILRHPGVWRCAVGGASVTDWRFYDTIYTERYMQTPQENPDGYKSSSCLTYASRLEGKLLLIHGTADDNVHVQNTMRLAEELQKAGKQFEMMLYPDEMHGVGRREHLNRMILEFLKRELSDA